MQIAYSYIEEYLNIKGQGINFGSPFLFETKETAIGYVVTSKPNNGYVPELFRRQSDNRVDNVSAIVGQNGAGKTNLLHYLMNAISGHAEFVNGFVILTDRHGRVNVINHSKKTVTFDFEMEAINYYRDFAAIYYNPIYDFQDHQGDFSSRLFNVSSNNLIDEDYREDEYFNETLDAFSYHKFKNVSRQVRFIISQKNSRIINNYIKIPREITVAIINPKLDHDYQKLHNVSYDFRPFYNIGVEIWRIEKDAAFLALENARAKSSRGIGRHNKTLAYTDILFYIWKFIFYTQERNNGTLREGVVSEYSQNDYEDLKRLSLEEYMIQFLRRQNIFDATSIINFMNVVKDLFKKVHRVEDDSSHIAVTCNLSQVEVLLNAYDVMVDQLSLLLAGKRPNGLLQFKWRSMSSGEKAFLDLFSRINHGVKAIHDAIYSRNKYPDPTYIYLFFDEAEVGFHLQWQKEYVKILMDLLPRIIRFGLKGPSPHIQLIFTTHSPISLSDIPRYNTIYLSQDKNNEMKVHTEADTPKYSFGANVHEIMYDAFYLRDGFTGKFSKDVIDELFAWTNDQPGNKLTETYARKVIDLIDDPILRIKLEELYAHKIGLNTEEEVLKAKIKLMEKRLKDILSSKDDQDKQQ